MRLSGKQILREAGDTCRNSPVGLLMQRIIAESLEISFEEARKLAKEQLLKAAGRKRYYVTTPGEDARERQRMARRVNPVLESGKSGHPAVHSSISEITEPAAPVQQDLLQILQGESREARR